MDIKKVLVAGSGVLGQQIGFQCAMHGFETVMYDIAEEPLKACQANQQQFAELFQAQAGKSKEEVDAALARISYTTDLAEAGKDADLVSESVPENPEIKQKFYAQLSKCCPEKTIFTTNTSTLLPSQFAEASGRPDRLLSLHFANPIWDTRIAEVMPHAGTAPEIFERVLKFAQEIGMVPIRLEKEQNGYIINSLLVPLLTAAQSLLSNEVASPEAVDKTWMLTTKMPLGPFGILDVIGLETAVNVFGHWAQESGDAQLQKNADYIRENFTEKGKLGVGTGEGFYTYPDPVYAKPDFLD